MLKRFSKMKQFSLVSGIQSYLANLYNNIFIASRWIIISDSNYAVCEKGALSNVNTDCSAVSAAENSSSLCVAKNCETPNFYNRINRKQKIKSTRIFQYNMAVSLCRNFDPKFMWHSDAEYCMYLPFWCTF